MIKCAYSATVSTFLNDVRTGQLQSLMQEGARNAGFSFGKREQYSWIANEPHIVRIIKNVHPEALIALELSDPLVQRNRADVVLFGIDNAGTQRLIVLELKQWSQFEVVEGSERFVRANLYGSTVKETIHPSLQASQFVDRLCYWVESCYRENKLAITCSGYALLFNMSEPSISQLRDGQYSWTQQEAPAIGNPEIDIFAASLRQDLRRGNGETVYNHFGSSAIRPSRQFIELATEVINGRDIFPLIPEQLQVYDRIRRALISATQGQSKSVIVVSGQPGSGKTAVALQAMSEIFQNNLCPTYVVKSAAMKESLQKELGDLLSPLISYNDRFGYLPQNSCDVLLVDESHRIDGIASMDWSSGNRRQKTREELKSSLPIVQEIIKAAKVSVFFIDERQIIQPGEANRIEDICEAADKENATVVNCQLEAQHRLAGSLEFIDWVDTLFSSPTPNLRELGDIGTFSFEVVDSPDDLVAIHENWESKLPNQSRLLTGWCWNWSQKPLEDGSLAKEVIIPGSIAYPWEAPKKGKPGCLAKGIARGEFWATHPSGANSFGSVYTAQGFDIATVCLLWSLDLLWRDGQWVGNPMRNRTKRGERGGHPHYDNVDPKLAGLNNIEIVPFLLNVYRILMTRATKRLYVSFLDRETKDMVQNLLPGRM